MNMIRTLAALFAAAALSGCVAMQSNQMVVQIDCVPSGALVYEGDKAIGQCPAEISYPITPFDRQMGVVETPPLTARWASGAEQTLPGYRTPVEQGGYRITFSRPEDAPNLDKDLAASNDWERRMEMQAQNEAMRDQAEAIYFHQLAMERHYRAMRRGFYGGGYGYPAYGWGGGGRPHYYHGGGGRPPRPDRPNNPNPSNPPPAAEPSPPPSASDDGQRPGWRRPPPDLAPETRDPGRPGLRRNRPQ